MKKTVLISLLVLLSLSLIPGLAQGDVGKYDKDWCKTTPLKEKVGGLVPCGRNCNDPTTDGIDESKPCQLCDFFVMIDGWIDGLLIMVVPPLAVLMIVIGGWMYIVSQGNPEMLSKAKKLFTAVVIGLLIIYGAYLIVGMFLWGIGLNTWTHDIYHNWWEKGLFEIPCP